MITAKAYAALDKKSPLQPHTITRREPGAHDVLIEIKYCGICHSDVHQARDEWGGSTYPMVPGHEIVGTVTGVGGAVSKFAVGDTVGVGCMVDSCRTCTSCQRGFEQYCDGPISFTYNSRERDGKTMTHGGYSSQITVDEAFVLRVRKDQPLDAVAPLLCAGITMFSPLRHWRATKGTKVGVVGLGGLGHMAVKIAAAMGCEVTMISTSPSKKADAQRLGAHDFLLSKDGTAMKNASEHFDLLLDTVSADHDLAALAGLLRVDGTMVIVGLPERAQSVHLGPFVSRRRTLAGSMIGGIAETQEMLDFCADHKIVSDIEGIAARDINTAYERLLRSDVRYRFVIDNATL